MLSMMGCSPCNKDFGGGGFALDDVKLCCVVQVIVLYILMYCDLCRNWNMQMKVKKKTIFYVTV